MQEEMQRFQAQIQAQQAAQAEAHRRELEAVQEREAQRTAEFARFFGSLNLPGVTVPASLLTPYVPPPRPGTPIDTPVSIYGCLLL